MIRPSGFVAAADVAEHYDHLDAFYLDLWGEHVHHGLWLSGREAVDVAVRQLVDLVALAARIRPGDDVCDIGAGYGAAARQLAEEYGARVTALTLSRRQFEYARRRSGGVDNPRYVLGDFLDGGLSEQSFDAAIAIECASHMADPGMFAEEVRRILLPGGRFVMCAWVAAEQCSERNARLLLEPICREGRLCQLSTAREYVEILENAGLTVLQFRDLSRSVRRTWSVVIRRTLQRLLTRPEYLRFLLTSRSGQRVFLLTILRVWLAYRVGALRYCLFACRKSGSGAEVPAIMA